MTKGNSQLFSCDISFKICPIRQGPKAETNTGAISPLSTGMDVTQFIFGLFKIHF